MAEEMTEAEARDLWDVLTALRGPDDAADYGAKTATTAAVRYEALPLTAARRSYGPFSWIGYEVRWPDLDAFRKVAAAAVNVHFKAHLERAARVLWGEEVTG